jgi:hypothetical protein
VPQLAGWQWLAPTPPLICSDLAGLVRRVCVIQVRQAHSLFWQAQPRPSLVLEEGQQKPRAWEVEFEATLAGAREEGGPRLSARPRPRQPPVVAAAAPRHHQD